jgi:AraC family transcriptional regulator
MAKIEVRVVQLKAMRVASVQVIGPSPEMAVWQKLKDWATPKGLLGKGVKARLFGFNNPDPEPGKQEYGYEMWLVVGAKTKFDADVKIKDFKGGRYAVLRVKGAQNISGAWQQLVAWAEAEHHQLGQHQHLEEMVTLPEVAPEELTLDLHMPIK